MEYQLIEGGVCAAKGFQASGVHCGIRKNHTKKDLALIFSEAPCRAAAIYTQNKVKGAPLTVTKNHIANGCAQGLLCNSGNANTCNADGEEVAEKMCGSLLPPALSVSLCLWSPLKMPCLFWQRACGLTIPEAGTLPKQS